ncbi:MULTISPECIES: ABC transporter permease [unclassified Coleofasciculus]|uniref:ABC transporter permease n=1 Tax=unclassified Coleofasciculus TaxID=2692782 RepID=UPI0018826529|nr:MULTISPECIES: ABC transporter permease [unclassified Coleofasciculus]MBE9125858.1 ABC transporter permease [Coleofasciculus sp. LEGE 07081]MBE9149177.1 ABC transporter permease [Coleofasciculus sp. LEGE 07092]
MLLNWIDRIGDWNPQLLRETKGRLNVRNGAIAAVISALGQLIVYLSYRANLPVNRPEPASTFNRYCIGTPPTDYWQGSYVPSPLPNDYCIKDAAGQFIINWQLWWLDLFIAMSLMGIFALLVVGTYMLISDLGHEERRGTLNFIRLSPQSTQSIWLGKLLGVPILLYLAAGLMVPLHLWAGLSAHLPLVEILSFWTVLVASCAFFYSAALLFGLFASWFSGFQAWLGSGAVLVFLYIVNFTPITHSPMDWLNLFNPSVLLPYFVDRTGSRYTNYPFNYGEIQGWEFFNLPLGATGFSVVILALLNYCMWTYWIGQALNRRFRNPNATMLSKGQSYWLVASWMVFSVGFALQPPRAYHSSQFFFNLNAVLALNLVLFAGLIAALSPQRQALQDWARYRHQGRTTGKSSLVGDLLWNDKSPALLAIAINLIIAALPIALWILVWQAEVDSKLQALSALILNVSIIAVYAAIAQLMLLMKTRKRGIWAIGTLAAAIGLPPFVLSVLSIYPGQEGGGLWLFTAFAWDNVIQHASATLLFQTLLIQVGILSVLNWQLTRQLQRLGESASKALFAGRPSLPA